MRAVEVCTVICCKRPAVLDDNLTCGLATERPRELPYRSHHIKPGESRLRMQHHATLLERFEVSDILLLTSLCLTWPVDLVGMTLDSI